MPRSMNFIIGSDVVLAKASMLFSFRVIALLKMVKRNWMEFMPNEAPGRAIYVITFSGISSHTAVWYTTSDLTVHRLSLGFRKENPRLAR